MKQIHHTTQKVLVVDNNPVFLREVAGLLRGLGHEVLCVDNVIACLDLLAAHSPDIIFVDYIMPHMDGSDLCRAIRNYPHLQDAFIVILSEVVVEQPIDVQKIGANGCIAKAPFARMRVHIEEILEEALRPREKAGGNKWLRGGEQLHSRETTSELLQQNSHLKVLLQNMSQGILEIVSGRVIYLNTSGAEMLNILPEEIIGADIYTSLPRGLLDLLVEREGDQLPLKGGVLIQFNERQLLTEIFPVSGERKGTLVILTDITERKRMESVIEAANLTENMGYVFSGIRHEIGNPVNSIKMALSVLQRNLLEYDTTTVAEFLDRSLQEIGRIEYLLKALKNYSLFESPVVQDIPVREFLADFVALVRSDFEQLGININILIPDLNLILRADPRALHHVLLNLLTNAADALSEASRPQITISSQVKGDMVLIKVDDNGKGVSENDLHHLFKPFFTTKAKGTGLGLAIVRKMMTSMEGLVYMESYLGIGSTVTLQLPGARDESEQKDPSPH